MDKEWETRKFQGTLVLCRNTMMIIKANFFTPGRSVRRKPRSRLPKRLSLNNSLGSRTRAIQLPRRGIQVRLHVPKSKPSLHLPSNALLSAQKQATSPNSCGKPHRKLAAPGQNAMADSLAAGVTRPAGLWSASMRLQAMSSARSEIMCKIKCRRISSLRARVIRKCQLEVQRVGRG
jgi:hypothetical protein